MVENAIVVWMLKYWGPLGAALSLGVLVAVRFGPPYLQGLREKRLAAQQEKLDAGREHTQRERDLLLRIDRKDDVLAKLTGNHIQHLEAQMAKTDAFHDAMVEHLRAMTHDLRELRSEIRDVRDISLEIKGRVQ